MNRNMFGIDLGSYDIKVYDVKENEIRKYKNAIAIQKILNKKHVCATGDDAWEMYEKCPPYIHVTYPMEGGVVSDFDAMQYLLQELVWGSKKSLKSGAGYLLAAPSDITEVEKKCFFDLVIHSDARTRNVRLVPRAIADAIGLGINVYRENGAFLINIGGETTEYSVISSGGLVINKMIKTGGKQIDQAIASFIRREYNFLVGVFAAEKLKNEMGYAFGVAEESTLVPGRSLISGLPGEIEINAHEVYTAIRPVIEQMLKDTEQLLDRIPPEIAYSIQDSGLYLTGGVARLKNLDKLFEKELGIPVILAEEPDYTTILGLRKIILDDRYDKLTYSMLDNRFHFTR